MTSARFLEKWNSQSWILFALRWRSDTNIFLFYMSTREKFDEIQLKKRHKPLILAAARLYNFICELESLPEKYFSEAHRDKVWHEDMLKETNLELSRLNLSSEQMSQAKRIDVPERLPPGTSIDTQEGYR